MAYEYRDAQALQAANDNYFPSGVVSTGHSNAMVMRIEVGKVLTSDRPAARLYAAIVAAERFFNDGATTTVWVDVLASQVPRLVTEAVKQCAGQGIAIVVTHDGRSTATEAAAFPAELVDAVKAATRNGWIWNPLSGKLVYTQR